jgi:hypothetical protein
MACLELQELANVHLAVVILVAQSGDFAGNGRNQIVIKPRNLPESVCKLGLVDLAIAVCVEVAKFERKTGLAVYRRRKPVWSLCGIPLRNAGRVGDAWGMRRRRSRSCGSYSRRLNVLICEQRVIKLSICKSVKIHMPVGVISHRSAFKCSASSAPK